MTEVDPRTADYRARAHAMNPAGPEVCAAFSPDGRQVCILPLRTPHAHSWDGGGDEVLGAFELVHDTLEELGIGVGYPTSAIDALAVIERNFTDYRDAAGAEAQLADGIKVELARYRRALAKIAAWPEDTDAVPDGEDYRYWEGGAVQAEIARAALRGFEPERQTLTQRSSAIRERRVSE